MPCLTIFPLVLKFESSAVVFIRILTERIFQPLLLGHNYCQSRFIGLQGLVGLILPFIFQGSLQQDFLETSVRRLLNLAPLFQSSATAQG